MKIECNNGPLMAGENDARTLTLTVEEAYASHEIRLAFLTPAGHRCLSPEIRMQNGAAAYPLPACLLDTSGKLLAQIVAENGEGQVAKSEVYAFSVERSITCDDGEFTDSGFVTLGQLDDAVKALQADMVSLSPAAFSGSYADLADTPAIPEIPQNVSAFANDAGYLTQHQSLAAYYTADETEAAVASAIADALKDPASFVIDAALSDTSENAVQNKAIKAALDGKADKTAARAGSLTFKTGYGPAYGSDQYVHVRQLGKIVWINAKIQAAGGFSLYDTVAAFIGGVDLPSHEVLSSCMTYDKDLAIPQYHLAELQIIPGDNSLRIKGDSNDDTANVNIVYFTE